MQDKRPCYCGSQLTFEECCEPFILEKECPSTAEELMRSRYSAFATCASGYLVKTAHPALRKQQDESDIRAWAMENKWQKLEIVSTKKGRPDDLEGEVEFKAFYIRSTGLPEIHHERSAFVKSGGHWFYFSGVIPPKTMAKTQNRNDQCHCGSGKKYKHCCG